MIVKYARDFDLVLYGHYNNMNGRDSETLEKDAKVICRFLRENYNCCIFDLPNNLLITVIEGELTLVAANSTKLAEIFGESRTSEAEWLEAVKYLRPDLAAMFIAKYVRGS